MSAKTVFISYRRDAVGKMFARSLTTALEHRGYDVFLDVDGIDAGGWADQIQTEIPKRAHFLLLLTPGSLDRCADEGDWVRREFELARESGRNIVPVREESVDLGDLAKNCPESMKAVFELQIADLRHGSFEADVLALTQRYVAPHQAPSNSPTESPKADFRAEISRILRYAPEELIGREEETQLLNDAWAKVQNREAGRPHVLTFVALGGEGKTSLVAKWAAELAGRDWPGCEAAFAWSFYSQGTRDQVAASSDLFLTEALTFFGDPEMANSPQGAFDKGRRLAQLVGERRALLILDGVEPLQFAPTSPMPGQLKDQGLTELLKGLAANNHGLCVVTTRYSLPDLKAFWQTTAPEVTLLRLSRDAGVHLLKTLGVTGTEEEFEALVEDVKGHALTLTLLGGFLKRAFHGDIRQRDRVKFEKADEKMDGGHAFRTMAAYEQWLLRDGGEEGRREVAVLRLMGLFDRPADAGCLAALRSEPTIEDLTEPLAGLAEEDWEFCLSGLEAAKLLTVNRSAAGMLVSLDAHPHLREYFAKQLRERDDPAAWHAAHRRLYEHLCETTKEGDEPTLEDLQPLYQAVVHGCLAGLQQEVCDEVCEARIWRRGEIYTIRKLGAVGSDLGAIACFFDQPWTRVSGKLTEFDRSFILNCAVHCLSANGRLAEALEPMRASVGLIVKQKEWMQSSAATGNLSQLKLTLGKVIEAVEDAEQSLIYADRSGDAKQRCWRRATVGDALHHAGRRAEAETRFREAEQMEAERLPGNSFLCSLRGFQYCNLLLAPSERAAWRKLLRLKIENDHLKTLSDVSQRAVQALRIAEQHLSLLDIAHDHLTLGRTALYKVILKNGDRTRRVNSIVVPLKSADPPRGEAAAPFAATRRELDTAVDGLRRSGQLAHLPDGLLNRAWLRFLDAKPTGPDSAQADLDEAWEIAERGPMRLYMADIHLHRARLFGMRNDDREEYPWESPQADLAEARRLIEKCGYWRRKEELEDAEKALGIT